MSSFITVTDAEKELDKIQREFNKVEKECKDSVAGVSIQVASSILRLLTNQRIESI